MSHFSLPSLQVSLKLQENWMWGEVCKVCREGSDLSWWGMRGACGAVWQEEGEVEVLWWGVHVQRRRWGSPSGVLERSGGSDRCLSAAGSVSRCRASLGRQPILYIMPLFYYIHNFRQRWSFGTGCFRTIYLLSLLCFLYEYPYITHCLHTKWSSLCSAGFRVVKPTFSELFLSFYIYYFVCIFIIVTL